MDIKQLKDAYQQVDNTCNELEHLDLDLAIMKDSSINELFVKHLGMDLEDVIRKMRRVQRDIRKIEVN